MGIISDRIERTGVVLAGGKSLRLGIDKSFIEIKGRMLIESVVERLTGCADEIIIVVGDERKKEGIKKVLKNYDISIVVDSIKDFGLVAGIYEGLKHAKSEYCGVFANDHPFLNKDLINFFFRSCKGFDAAIAIWGERYREPLHAVYRRDPMIKACKSAIKKQSKKVFSCVKLLKNVNYIPIEEIKKIDPELKSFVNINTKEDLELMKKL